MYINKLELESFKQFKRLEFAPVRSMNVLVGVNGSGKSTILLAITILLSWYVKRLVSPQVNGAGQPVSEKMIRHGDSSVLLSLQMVAEGLNVSWSLAKARSGGRGSVNKSDLSGLTAHIKSIRDTVAGLQFVPVVAAYGVHRVALEVPQRIRRHRDFGLFDAYDRALDGSIDFRSFFEWFRQMEDLENQEIAARYRVGDKVEENVTLSLVRTALERFAPELTDWRMSRQPTRLMVRKEGQLFNVEELSDGEKSLIALVGDIARRLILANPGNRNALNGCGVVLIDEVELHLHPAWQVRMLPQLMKTFPGVQFFVSTHSPLVLSQLNNEIMCRRLSEEQQCLQQIGVYTFSDGNLVSMLDEETGLVLPSIMDDVVTEVDQEFDRYLEKYTP